MVDAVLKSLHLLAVVVWVGGMVFAHFFLRPAVARLDPPLRLRLVHDALGRFFKAVLAAPLLVLASGLSMVGRVARQVMQGGSDFAMPLAWAVMAALGTVMVAIVLHIRFALYARLPRAVAAADWPAGGKAMVQIRRGVAVNLTLGVATLLVTLLGA